MTDATNVVTNPDVIGLFGNSPYANIVLFVFFAIFIFLLSYMVYVNRGSYKSNRELSKSFMELAQLFQKSISTSTEMDKKYVDSFKSLRELMMKIDNSVGDLRTEVTGLHNWCMGRNQTFDLRNNDKDKDK